MSYLADKFRLQRLSVEEAQQLIRESMEEGISCPCCQQHVQLYRRQIHKGMVEFLFRMYSARGTKWIYVPSLKQKSRDFHFLRYWGLLEQKQKQSGVVPGMWRVTEKGEQWLKGKVSVPRYALVYNNRCLRLEGPPWRVDAAIGKDFNLMELTGHR